MYIKDQEPFLAAKNIVFWLLMEPKFKNFEQINVIKTFFIEDTSHVFLRCKALSLSPFPFYTYTVEHCKDTQWGPQAGTFSIWCEPLGVLL